MGQKGGGTKEDGATAVIYQLWDDAVVQRSWIQKQPGPSKNRQEGACGKAKGVKHGQGVEDLIARSKIDHRQDLGNIGHNGPVREHHALGCAFRTRGEEHHRSLFRIMIKGKGAWAMASVEQIPEFVAKGYFLAQIFKIDDAQPA